MENEFRDKSNAGQLANGREDGTSGTNAVLVVDVGRTRQPQEEAEAPWTQRIDKDDAVSNAGKEVGEPISPLCLLMWKALHCIGVGTRGVEANNEEPIGRIRSFNPGTKRGQKKTEGEVVSTRPPDAETSTVNGCDDGIEVKSAQKPLDVAVEKNPTVVWLKLSKRDAHRVLVFDSSESTSERVLAPVLVTHRGIKENVDMESEDTVNGFPGINLVDKDNAVKHGTHSAVDEVQKRYDVLHVGCKRTTPIYVATSTRLGCL